MNLDLGKKAKKWFSKRFFNLMNNTLFRKAIGNLRKHRDIKLVPTEKRRNYFVSESNYHTTKFFIENMLAIETKRLKDT